VITTDCFEQGTIKKIGTGDTHKLFDRVIITTYLAQEILRICVAQGIFTNSLSQGIMRYCLAKVDT
jgi:hypothetical protein